MGAVLARTLSLLDAAVTRSAQLGRFMAYNGRYVVISYWAALYAYEAKTGKIVWKIGR